MYYSKQTYNIMKKLNRIEATIQGRKNLEENIEKLQNLLNQPYCKNEIKSVLAKAYLEYGESEKSLDLLKYLYESTNKGEYLINIVNLLMDIGYVENAKKYIDDAPYSDEKVFSLGSYNKRMGNYDEALECFKRLKHTTMEEDAYIEMGLTYMIKGDNNIAKEYFSKLLNTSKKNEALVKLIKIALAENDPNIEELFKKVDVDNCYHQGDIIQYKRCVQHYQYLMGSLNKEKNNYSGEQLYNYSKERALEHVKKKHVSKGKLYRFFDNVDINELYDYCLEHLDNIIYRDDKTRYLVEMPYDVGYLMNLKTNIIEVIVLSNTNKILTMYPITRVGKYNIKKIKEKNRGNHEK